MSIVANVPLLIDSLSFFIRCRSIKDATAKSGAGRSGWVYFEKMDQILHKDKATEPAETSSSCEKT